jgi:hypothetical protein
LLLPRSEPDFSAERFKAHVTFLADDLLEGREAGTRGHEIAAKYIAAQFASIGLKPGGDDGTYFKKVDLHESALTTPAPTLSITTPAGEKTFKQGVTAMIGGALAGGSIRVRGPLVFGYGMTDKAMGYDDYQGLNVRDKIAVVLLGSPKGMDSEIGAHLLHEQLRFAAEHGAVGLLRIPTRLMSTALPWDKVVQYRSNRKDQCGNRSRHASDYLRIHRCDRVWRDALDAAGRIQASGRRNEREALARSNA